MKEKTFTLRVDLESDKGIKSVPKLLNLLKKYKIKASFYLVMGGESGIFDLIKYSGGLKSASERTIKIWSLKEKIRITLFPKDFVKENIKILKRILDEGHELGLHGWKHREWTRGLHKINIEKRILMAKKRYSILFGKNAVSWVSPGFNTNKRVIEILKKYGINFISDFEGKEVRKYSGIKNVPITILGENKTPIIEFLVSEGKKDDEIIKDLKDEIKKKNLASLYIHGLFEARFKLNILEDIFKFVNEKKIKSKRIIDY